MAPSLHLPRHHAHHNQQQPQPQLQEPASTAAAPARPAAANSTASAKGQHYAQTLDQIRRLALWTAPAPALAKGAVNWTAADELRPAAPTGANPAQAQQHGTAAQQGGMDWNEVLRKFRKHNPERTLTAATAATEQTLRSLLAKTSPQVPTIRAASTDSSSSPSFLPPPLPTQLASADRPAASEALAELQGTLRDAQASAVEADSARVVLALGHWALGSAREAVETLRGSGTARELPASRTWEPYDLTLRVMASAIEGYSLESLGQSAEALAAYRMSAEMYEAALDALSATAGRDSSDISLHRIGGDVLVRVALLSRTNAESADPAASSTTLETSYSAHRAYLAHSSTFSRAGAAFPHPSLFAMHRSFRALQNKLARWDANIVSQNDRAQERILRRTTTLPKAGETNREYLRFLDEVVGAWRARGAPRSGAEDIIAILYNALTHTFQSQLLLRYLIRALTIAGRYEEATKALKLYRDLWDKARETDAKEVAKEMRELRSRAIREEAARNGKGDRGEKAGQQQEEGAREKPATAAANGGNRTIDEPYAVDIDSDAAFVETIVFGVRLLCRHFDDRAKDAVELARRARAVFDEGKDEGLRRNEKAQADLERALGSALGALARQDPDATRRPKRLADSRDHLRRAVSLDPSSSLNHYILSYHLLEQRQVPAALESAREAVRLDSNSKEAWHLLALCVSAEKDWRGALEVLETAIDLQDLPSEEGAKGVDGPSDVSAAALTPEAAADRWDHPTDETDRLAIEVELRLTKSAVVEYLEGPAAGLAEQQEVLAYFTEGWAKIAPASKSAAPTTAKSDSTAQFNSNEKPVSGLAPPVASSVPVSRTGSILGRRRSAKRRSNVPAAHAMSPIPPLHADESASMSTPPRSVAGESTAASVATVVSAPSPPSSAAPPPSSESDPAAARLLASVWLASAASFRRAGRLDEAQGAVAEAEALDLDNPAVWTQLALVWLARGDQGKARDALNRTMALDERDVALSVITARMHLTPPPGASEATSSAPSVDTGSCDDQRDDEMKASDRPAPTWKRPLPTDWLVLQLPLAEAMLETVTAREAYDSPEAWFELSRCYHLTGRHAEERQCLVRALELERSRPVRVLGAALPRCL